MTTDSIATNAIKTPATGLNGLNGIKNAELQNSDSQTQARITAPSNGSIIALDPDIPPKHQRLSFSAEGRKLRWQLDGKPLARGNQVQWPPWPGRHTLQLLDSTGVVQDEVKFEVRGAGVKLLKSN